MSGVSEGQLGLLLTNYPKQHHHGAIDFQLMPDITCIAVIVVVHFSIALMPELILHSVRLNCAYYKRL